MAFETVRGLLVEDQDMYTRYRASIMPLLEAAGGSFRYDVEVSRVLRGEESRSINRLFVLRFPSRASFEQFFADPAYLAVRYELFEPAVREVISIAEYERD